MHQEETTTYRCPALRRVGPAPAGEEYGKVAFTGLLEQPAYSRTASTVATLPRSVESIFLKRTYS